MSQGRYFILSLKAIIYNKMRYEDSTVKSIDKEF